MNQEIKKVSFKLALHLNSLLNSLPAVALREGWVILSSYVKLLAERESVSKDYSQRVPVSSADFLCPHDDGIRISRISSAI